MLRISKLADYGTVIMNCLANDPEITHKCHEIAHKVHLALPTTSKILKMLVSADLVSSVRGSGGGYRLSRPSEHITVAEIITALDGQPALTECTAIAKKCPHEGICGVRDNWHLINKVVFLALNSLTLADMMKPINLHPTIVQGIQFEQR
ncbi:MAG: SUF system Fe-S cluster assembly regulator [Gammaproteobacteria bacterium]|nr:SUF system Fe-S cluster assembly regulator [Gammaproteobacteria bacterium]